MEIVNVDPKRIGEQLGKKGLLGEFKDFALKGNVLDMAVGIVIGAAFSSIVNSFVNDLILPLVGFISAGKDFTAMKVQLSEESFIQYGSFIQTLINFFVIALSVFIMVKVINIFRTKKSEADAADAVATEGPSETDILIEIRDLLKERG
ncbi:MAG: large conductance mechanosensitive channel protein MscL [Clostridiales Family XIII bacterium]|jgi:large conductance mechanosensitive channel|nr:large conductance mechanosensitive channel protein MscL [Clostridiales Family XIII bacterium]